MFKHGQSTGRTLPPAQDYAWQAQAGDTRPPSTTMQGLFNSRAAGVCFVLLPVSGDSADSFAKLFEQLWSVRVERWIGVSVSTSMVAVCVQQPVSAGTFCGRHSALSLTRG